MAHFFEQDHLLNLFISGVYAKRWPKCARISMQNLKCPKILWMSFFLTLTVRGPFHRRWKKWLISGLISEKNWVNFWKKTEVSYAELNERAEAANGSYSVTGDSLQYIYSVPVTKNHLNIQSRCLVHEFSFRDIF